MLRIAVLDDYGDVSSSTLDWSSLPDGSTVTVFDQPIPRSEAVATLVPFDVLCTIRERTPLPGDVLRELPKLKLVVTLGTDIMNLDREAARAAGIAVVSATPALPGGDDGSALASLMAATPELTWALVLACVRHVAREDRGIREGGWQTGPGIVLAGRTLGLLGFGTIAKHVAKYARAFDMDVVAWSPSLTPETAAAAGARRVEKDELFRQAAVLSIHVTLNDGTRGLVGTREFGLMRPGSYLVNTSRGPIVDEAALIAALEDGTIAGAGLDVFDQEPLPPAHPFRSLPNVTVTPHLGYATQESLSVMLAGVPAAVAEFFASHRD